MTLPLSFGAPEMPSIDAVSHVAPSIGAASVVAPSASDPRLAS
jgi:hypothetical protein